MAFKGARFYKVALQVNPWDYLKNHRGQEAELSPDDYAKEILQKCKDLSIECIAITDHNSSSSIDIFRKYSQQYGIHVFPGFEVSSSEGVHILGIFPKEETQSKLKSYLGEFGLHDEEPNTSPSSCSCLDLIKSIKDKGGIAIAAHVTTEKGLLTTLTGEPRANNWKSHYWDAVQIPNSIENLDHTYKQIIQNKDPNYKRQRAPGENLGIAVVNAYDIAKPDDLERDNATVNIKMTTPSIEGLRQAFIDPVSRIRLNSDPVNETEFKLESMSFEGGFFDGVSINLSSHLNVLIGGRGTGKSSFVEAIRHVLDVAPVSDEAKKSNKSIVKDVIGDGTKITINISSKKPSPSQYKVQCIVPAEPVIYNQNNEKLDFSPRDLVKNMKIYGQHELGEIVASESKISHLIAPFVEVDDSLQARKITKRKEIEENSTELKRALSNLQDEESDLSELPLLQEELKRYKEAGVEEKLAEQKLLIEEEGYFSSTIQKVTDFENKITETFEDLSLDIDIPETTNEEDEPIPLPGDSYLQELSSKLKLSEKELSSKKNAMLNELEKLQKEHEEIKTKWIQERKESKEKEILETVKELKKDYQDFDFEKYSSVQKRTSELATKSKSLDEKKEKVNSLRKKRSEHLSDWDNILQEEFLSWQRACKKVTRKLKNHLKVEISFQSDRGSLIDKIGESIEGQTHNIKKSIEGADSFSMRDFIDTCRKGSSELMEKYLISEAQAKKLHNSGEELFTKLDLLELGHQLKILLNVGQINNHEWKEMNRLSKGQKVTAALLLILLDDKYPLIIDQPEDDLDNHFIAEGIVPSIRESKNKRQFILSTHNANIPVLGDAELVVSLSAEGESSSGTVELQDEQIGSIDKKSVKDSISTVLEGGEEAFLTRKRKYGI